jgi:hypothetical protein
MLGIGGRVFLVLLLVVSTFGHADPPQLRFGLKTLFGVTTCVGLIAAGTSIYTGYSSHTAKLELEETQWVQSRSSMRQLSFSSRTPRTEAAEAIARTAMSNWRPGGGSYEMPLPGNIYEILLKPSDKELAAEILKQARKLDPWQSWILENGQISMGKFEAAYEASLRNPFLTGDSGQLRQKRELTVKTQALLAEAVRLQLAKYPWHTLGSDSGISASDLLREISQHKLVQLPAGVPLKDLPPSVREFVEDLVAQIDTSSKFSFIYLDEPLAQPVLPAECGPWGYSHYGSQLQPWCPDLF